MKPRVILSFLAIILLVSLLLVRYAKRDYASWCSGNSFDDGMRIQYCVYGYLSGEPIAGLLVYYDSKIGLTNPIVYSVSGAEFIINNQLIKPSDKFQLYINKQDGKLAKIELPVELAKVDFSRNWDHSREDLRDLWKKHSPESKQ